jgi:hypothetical protein
MIFYIIGDVPAERIFIGILAMGMGIKKDKDNNAIQ